MSDQIETSPKNNWLNAVGGAALGALITLLLALSNTAVVSATLTVFIGAAVVFLALQDKASPERANSMTPALLYRIIGFAFAGIIALLLGLFLRASNAFGDSESIRLYKNLIEIGVAEETAHDVILERLKGTTATPETETERLVRSTTLFSSEPSEISCSNMVPGEFNNVESLIARYSAEAGEWRVIADTVHKAMNANTEVDGSNLAVGLYSAYCEEHLK